jgi:hypothetical protein
LTIKVPGHGGSGEEPYQGFLEENMNRRFVIASVLACFGLGSSFVPIASATNLVADPSFELGTAAGPENTGGWTYFNGAAVNTLAADSHTGNNSVNLTDGGSGAGANVPGAFETTNIGVAGGAQYVLAGFGMTTGPMVPAGTSNNNASFAGLQATFFSGDNGGGANLGTVSTGAGMAIFSNHIDSTSPVGQWIPLTTGTFTAPAGAESLQIFAISIFPQELNAGTGVFIDDVDLELAPEPASIGLLAIGGLAALRRKR